MYGILLPRVGFAPIYYLVLSDKLLKQIAGLFILQLVLFLTLGSLWKCDLSLFYRYYFARCSSELAQLVPLPFLRGRSTHYSDRLHDFSVTILRSDKDVYVNSFFHPAARLWNSLPIECFPLTYDLSGFKSTINRHPLTVGSF